MSEAVEVGVISQVRTLLKWWGEYQRAISAVGYRLTYPHSSPIAHINETRAPITPIPQPSVIVRRVDEALTVLSELRADCYMAVRYKYEYQYTDLDAAKEMRAPKTKYLTLITQGEHFIAGRVL